MPAACMHAGRQPVCWLRACGQAARLAGCAPSQKPRLYARTGSGWGTGTVVLGASSVCGCGVRMREARQTRAAGARPQAGNVLVAKGGGGELYLKGRAGVAATGRGRPTLGANARAPPARAAPHRASRVPVYGAPRSRQYKCVWGEFVAQAGARVTGLWCVCRVLRPRGRVTGLVAVLCGERAGQPAGCAGRAVFSVFLFRMGFFSVVTRTGEFRCGGPPGGGAVPSGAVACDAHAGRQQLAAAPAWQCARLAWCRLWG